MKICMPVENSNGIESSLSNHFGSAPFFLIVDTKSLEYKEIINTNQHHGHGMCQPLAVLANEKFDGVVVTSIGSGALNKLKAANIKVYRSLFSKVNEVIEAVNSLNISEIMDQDACSGHDHDHKH